MLNQWKPAACLALCTLISLMGSAQTECPNVHDGNHDGIVGIGDLLDLLGLYSSYSDRNNGYSVRCMQN